MGISSLFRFAGRVPLRIGLRVVCLLAIGSAAVGCQTGGPTVSNSALLAHLPGINFTGLAPMRAIEPLKVSCSVPVGWKPLKFDRHVLYSHQQWKSPSGYTGAGVVYAHLPIPLSANTLLWFAKLEYAKRGVKNSKLVGEWTDALGRPWFEGQNDRFHVRGYAVVNGGDAWIVYFGYKSNRPPDPAELSLAARCVETVVPRTGH